MNETVGGWKKGKKEIGVWKKREDARGGGHAPVCKTRDPDVRGAGKHERLNVTCEVDAHPPATAFRWAFNTSAEVVSIDPGRIEAVSGDLRDVVYTPRSQLDYGSLLCWATNSVGEQRVPCVFHIIHTAVPEPVHNCSVSEVSRTSAAVRCQGGWDGGLPQTFTLSVSQDAPAESSSSSNSSSSAPRVLANTSSSPKAEFSVTGLDAGKEYVLTVSAVNARGQSSPVRISLLTLEDKAQKRTSPGVTPKPKGELPLGPIIAGLVGAMASLLLSCIVIVLVVRARRSPHRGQCSRGGSQTEKSDSQSTANLTEPSVTTYIDTGESSPDVIPYTNVPTPPRSATVPMSLTFNNLSLMDVEHHHHHHHTLHQPPARLLQGQDVLYVAADLAAMQRTGSLPRPGLGKKPRDMSQLNRLDNSQLHNTLASPHSHASLRSLDQLGGGPPFVAPVGIMSEAVGQRPNSPPTASSQSKRHLSALVRGESVSLRGESDPVSDDLDKALVPSNQHQGTRCLKSQLKSRQQADPELFTSRQDRFSPTLRGSPLAVPYSPSSTSTTSSAQSGQLERTSGSENTTAYPPPAFSGVIRKTNNLVDAESNILNSPISAKVLPNTPSRSEFSDAIDVSSVCQLPPLDENVRYDGKVYSKNETFFSPPPMFSNSMPPFVVPKATQEYLPTAKVVFENVLNKSRVKNQQITDMKLVRLAADGPGQQIKTSSRPAQPSALDKDPAQRSHSGRSASPLNKKESSV
ncbi:Immunoglobulin-like domain [Trinorchestia longiramus]|nr:Immunoglobulin-like domain [Trinorchestia longiramus]